MATELVFDITNQQFLQSVTQPAVINTPLWFYGEVKHLSIKFVRRTAANTVTVVSGTGVAMQMALGNLTGPTVYTSATASAAVDDWFAVTLQLNVAGVQSALGSNIRISAVVEFQLTSVASEPEKYQSTINISQRLISTSLVDPPAGDAAIGGAEARTLFVPRDGSITPYLCSNFYMVDESDTSKTYNVVVRDGQLHAEPLN